MPLPREDIEALILGIEELPEFSELRAGYDARLRTGEGYYGTMLVCDLRVCGKDHDVSTYPDEGVSAHEYLMLISGAADRAAQRLSNAAT